jgi:hypothetical protein
MTRAQVVTSVARRKPSSAIRSWESARKSRPVSTGDLISGQPVVVYLDTCSYVVERHAMRAADRGVNIGTLVVFTRDSNASHLPV